MSTGHGGRPPPGPLEGPRSFPRELLELPTLEAARGLLGARLVRDHAPSRQPTAAGSAADRRVGRIVEVEAYVGLDDRASHARMGPTARNRVMFGPPGIAYVYLVYGMHHCLNVVTEPAPFPAALLIRAVEPIAGLAAMRAARGAHPARRTAAASTPRPHPPPRRPIPDAQLAAGPGLVAAAFDIDRSCTGLDLCDPASRLRLEIRPDDEPAPSIVAAPRIGIAYAGEPWVSVPWRLLVPGSPSLSRPAG